MNVARFELLFILGLRTEKKKSLQATLQEHIPETETGWEGRRMGGFTGKHVEEK